MAEITKETVTNQNQGPHAAVTRETKQVATTAQRTEYVLYFILGALEILLAFRLILKLTGASMASGFVTFIYGLTGIFVQPFEGIFRSATSAGVETTAVFEPSTVVAMIVYALLVWGIVKLIHIFSGEKLESE